MHQGNCTIKFYLKPLWKESEQGYPIYCRVIFMRKKAEFATGEYCHIDNWNQEAQLPTKNPRTTEYLLHLRSIAKTRKRNLEYQNKSISAKIIRDFLKNKDPESQPKLLKFYQEQVDKMNELPEDYKKRTIQKYYTTIGFFKEFLKQKMKKSNIFIHEIDYRMISNFDHFMVTEPTKIKSKFRTRNTVNSYHRKLKKILGDAVKEDIIATNPYNRFKIKDTPVYREALTKDEIKAILNHSFSNNSLKRVRDIFIFTCFTGIRFTDAQQLGKDNLHKDGQGNLWLKFKQGKVRRVIDFPLLSIAEKIIKNYELECNTTGYLLPHMSNQKTNDYLKVITRIVDIPKNVTHHVARHSFATTVLRSNEIPLEVIKEWMGHSTRSDITLLYAKLTEEQKLRHVKTINEHIKRYYYNG